MRDSALSPSMLRSTFHYCLNNISRWADDTERLPSILRVTFLTIIIHVVGLVGILIAFAEKSDISRSEASPAASLGAGNRNHIRHARLF